MTYAYEPRPPLLDPNYVLRVQLQPDGPVYFCRIRGPHAYFSRRREDGTLELLVRRHDHPVIISDPEACFADCQYPATD